MNRLWSWLQEDIWTFLAFGWAVGWLYYIFMTA